MPVSPVRRVGRPAHVSEAPGPEPQPEEIDLDSEALLAQGDELLKASRRLLADLDDRIGSDRPRP